MATATSKPGRMLRRDTCTVHGIEWGQEYIPAGPDGRESFWSPPFCPECEREFAYEEKFAALCASQAEEVAAEIEKRLAADTTRAARRSEGTDALMNEEIPRLLLKWWAENRALYEQHWDDLDWNRIAQEVQDEKREKFFEQLKKVGE
jgi:hypothetical protein